MKKTIDINCDAGESFGVYVIGNDAALFKGVTSANIAAGFHASDPVNLMRTIKLARDEDVAIGAHPGLPDLVGFGRRQMELSPEEAYCLIAYQASAVSGMAATVGAKLSHIKPHGALFKSLWTSRPVADAVAQAIRDCCPDRRVLMPTSRESDHFLEAAKASGLEIVGEFYPDLEYLNDGTPVGPKGKHEAALEDVETRLELAMREGKVMTREGSVIQVDFDSLCLHGDTDNASEILAAVRHRLEEWGVAVSAPAANGPTDP